MNEAAADAFNTREIFHIYVLFNTLHDKKDFAQGRLYYWYEYSLQRKNQMTTKFPLPTVR